MKKMLFYSLLAIGAVIFCNRETSVQVSVHIGGVIGGNPGPVYQQYPVYQSYPANLPPGQAKKLYGAKSAKNFAPGHAKKGRGHMYKHHRYNMDDQGYNVYEEAPYEVYTEPSRPRVVIDAHVRL